MGLFVTAPAGEKFTLNVEGSDTVENVLDKIEERTGYDVDYLVHGTAMLSDEMTLEEAGLETEANIEAHCELDGGKRKRKKKIYKTPKKIKHKHKKRPKAALEYYQVDNDGKIKRLKMESPHAPVGPYMADHPDRHVCGKTGFTLWRTGAGGKRLPIPKNNKPVQAQVVEAPKKAAAKKKGKK